MQRSHHPTRGLPSAARPQSPLAPVKRGRGVGGEGAHTPQHNATNQHDTAMQRSHHRTRGLPSAAHPQSPLAPVKRGRGVGGEGAHTPQHNATDQLVTAMQRSHHRTRGLPSAARLNTEHRTPNNVLCVDLRGFAASRETSSLQPPARSSDSHALQSYRNRSRAGKPALLQFLAIRGSHHPTSLCVYQ